MATNDKLFSATPKDMTPVKQDYSPGLGDRVDAVSYTLSFDRVGKKVENLPEQTYEWALGIQKMVANITNGMHQLSYTIAQDKLRWGSAPYLFEDPEYPMGDGTPGSGYRKYRKYVEDSFENNVDVAQIIEPLLAGRFREDYASEEEKIPLSCYTHDENGEKKVGWTAGEDIWYLLSLHNLYEKGVAQEAWKRMQETWNFRSHVYYDAMIPVPEGFYNNPNLTTQYGGEITNTEMEWDAVQKETKYSWENYAISSAQEHVHAKYKGLSCSFSIPYGHISDDDYLNVWQNSVVIGDRRDEARNLGWGSEFGHGGYSVGETADDPDWKKFTDRLMKYNLQYFYMLERKPLSYTSNDDLFEVVFSGDLVSRYDKKKEYYTLIDKGDFIIADGDDRFVPQVGAGCKIFTCGKEAKTRTWKLPETWAGVEVADMYKLSLTNAPEKICTVPVEDGKVTITVDAETLYIIVPEGDRPTPKTANFNELSDGDTVGAYQSLKLDMDGNPAIKVYGANARGGFSTPSIYADSADKETVLEIGIEDGLILHSLKIGNKGGEGRVVLHSSNPKNPDVMIKLPETDEVCKFNTSWVYGETGAVTMKIENADKVSNVLFDAVMYS